MAGPDQGASQAGTVEVVGRFADQESFRGAVEGLRGAGFERSDLSVLDTHESLSASKSPREAWQETLAGMVGEERYGTGHYGLARNLIESIVTREEFTDFMTLVGYEHLD